MPVTKVKTVNGVNPSSNANVAVVVSRVVTGIDLLIGAPPYFLVPSVITAPW
ncbi:MAG: hypothetical protein ACEQSF_00020 [Solirubrobacteraceae bacterium]